MTRREEGRERNDSPPPARVAGVWVRRGSQEESEQNISSCGNDLEQAPAINAGDETLLGVEREGEANCAKLGGRFRERLECHILQTGTFMGAFDVAYSSGPCGLRLRYSKDDKALSGR